MKRILSLILCVLMLVPCFALVISAEDEISDEYKNFALDDGVSAYGSSKWNNDSDPKYLNNDVLYDSYRFWRPDGYGRTPSIDDTMQYCGLKFTSGYYEVDKVTLYVGHYDYTNDIKYVIKALVLGEWVTIGEARALDGVAAPELSKDSDIITIDVENVVTKNIRLECSEYGRWSTYNQQKFDTAEKPPEDDPNTEIDESKIATAYHDWWKIPIIQEIQTWGTEAPPPPWDVPEGAVLSTNACLSGFADATSSYTTRAIYPALANDNLIEPTITTTRPYWMAYNKGAGESVWCEFDKAYDIVNVSVNFGSSVDGVTMKYDIQIQVNGVWETVVSDKTATSSVAKQDNIVYDLPQKRNATGVKVIFSEVTDGERALLTEMGALIDSEYKIDGVDSSKCVFLNEFLTNNRKQSTAIGNLACFGSAYASSLMAYASISAVDYINDGGISKNEDFSWFANTFAKGTYCGVALKKTYNVNKVVLYFNDPITGEVSGDHVMQFDIQAKDANGKFVTVKRNVTSYDKTKKEYVVSVLFDAPVATDDIRIVYTSNGMVFPYIKELEIYASDYVYGAYRGYQMGQRTNGGKAPNLPEDFAKRTLTPRSKYLDKISPIQYFELAMEYGLDILAWL